jgi:hypothetical protein
LRERDDRILRSAEFVRVRGSALAHCFNVEEGAEPLIRPSGTFSLKGRREEAKPKENPDG